MMMLSFAAIEKSCSSVARYETTVVPFLLVLESVALLF